MDIVHQKQYYGLWKTLNIILTIYNDIPEQIFEEFFEFEKKIICSLMWKSNSNLIKSLENMQILAY